MPLPRSVRLLLECFLILTKFKQTDDLYFPDSINVIDLEMTDINFAPYDIASYLVMLTRSHLISGKYNNINILK